MNEDIVKLFERVNDERENPELNPKFTFNEGEEEKFSKFIKEYMEKIYSQKERRHRFTEVRTLLTTFLNSMNNFDYEKLWKSIDKNSCCNDTLKIYESILKKIDFDTFKNELANIDNFKLVYNYYILYGNYHNISKEDIVNSYLDYLKSYQARTKKQNEYAFGFFFNYITALMPYYHGYQSHREEATFSFDQAVFNMEMEAEEKNHPEVRSPHLLIELPTTMSLLVRKLLPRINLNMSFDFDGEIRSFSDVIACKLYSIYEVDPYDWIKEFIEEYLKLGSKKAFRTFETRLVHTNTLNFAVMLGDMAEVDRIVNDENFEFSSEKTIELLKKEKTYSARKYSFPEDLLYWDLPNETFSHENLLKVLFNKKVRIINLSLIYKAITHKYLTQKEFEQLVAYIKENGIIVYDTDEMIVSVIDDIPLGLKKHAQQLDALNRNMDRFMIRI